MKLSTKFCDRQPLHLGLGYIGAKGADMKSGSRRGIRSLRRITTNTPTAKVQSHGDLLLLIRSTETQQFLLK
jgi:hypothetical protein